MSGSIKAVKEEKVRKPGLAKAIDRYEYSKSNILNQIL